MLAVALWLWLTILFANFAESLAEGRGKAQAASLRALKKTVWARKLKKPAHGAEWFTVHGNELLKKGDVVEVAAGEVIPLPTVK